MSHIKGWNPATGTTKTHDEMTPAEKAAAAREILTAQRENAYGRVIPVDYPALDLAKRLATQAEDATLVDDIDAAITAARTLATPARKSA